LLLAYHLNHLSQIWGSLQELDELLGGGIPDGAIMLLKGGAGTGKTTLASQIMANRSNDRDQCLYICLEESPIDSLKRIHRSFPEMGLKSKCEDKLIHPIGFNKIWSQDRKRSNVTYEYFVGKLNDYLFEAKVVVIDSLSA
jgi:KaiC/GvpD/RAD55 family RecA-like ATPase